MDSARTHVRMFAHAACGVRHAFTSMIQNRVKNRKTQTHISYTHKQTHVCKHNSEGYQKQQGVMKN